MLISLLFIVTAISAQAFYYDKTQTIKEEGYTYQCDVIEKAKYVRLYNKDNHFTYADQVNRNTGEIITIAEEKEKQFENDTWTRPKCVSIINDAFSVAEKQRVKGQGVIIILYIDSDSGKISEVEYQFLSIGPYATIPVSVYRKIEVELKKNIWFTPTKEGAKRNFILLAWDHEVK